MTNTTDTSNCQRAVAINVHGPGRCPFVPGDRYLDNLIRGAIHVICLALLFPGLPAVSTADIKLNWFDDSAFDANTAAMNSTLGISGFQIEDFEDTTLIDGLSYRLENPAGGSFTVLPATFSAGSGVFTNVQWDGTHVLLGNSQNGFPGEGVRSNHVIFSIAGGTSSFGIGLASFQSLSSPQYPITNHRLVVNGTDLGTIEALAGSNFSAGLPRNAYLRVDATGGDLVQSVEFQNIRTSGDIDLLVFDHVAMNSASIPEPGSAGICAIVLAVSLKRRKRRR